VPNHLRNVKRNHSKLPIQRKNNDKLSKRALFVLGKMPNPPEWVIPLLNSLHNFELKYLDF